MGLSLGIIKETDMNPELTLYAIAICFFITMFLTCFAYPLKRIMDAEHGGHHR